MITWRVGSATDTGRQRTRNEDAVAILDHGEDGFSLIVCDGMGGHEDGHIASAIATASLEKTLNVRFDEPEVSRVLHEALQLADRAVSDSSHEQMMGSTGVVARVREDRVWYGWVGDSRLYVLRNGRVVEHSEDHTRVAALVASGQMSPEEAKKHPDAHMLTQALGSGDVRPTVYADAFVAQAGDVVLLCSDGLHDLVSDDELGPAIADLEPEAAALHLISIANERGGHDNITVAIGVAVASQTTRAQAPAPATAPRRQTVGDVAGGEPPRTEQTRPANAPKTAPSPTPVPIAPPKTTPPSSVPIAPSQATAPAANGILPLLLLVSALSAMVGAVATSWAIHLMRPKPTLVSPAQPCVAPAVAPEPPAQPVPSQAPAPSGPPAPGPTAPTTPPPESP